MVGFIVRRALTAVVVVFLTSVFVFVLFFKGLGDSPAVNYCEKLGPGKCTPLKLESIKHQMGFDKSVADNYGQWLAGVFVGRQHVYVDGKDYKCPAPCFGISANNDDLVWRELRQKYPATLTLAVGGASLYLIIGVALGATAARWRGTRLDKMLVGSTLLISAIPFYLVALLAWIYLSQKLGIFPNTDYFPITRNPLRTVSEMALPWLVIGITNCTSYARFTRGQMVEVLNEDYIRTAESKGVRRSRILIRHALRAAVVPIITIFGLDFASLLAGTIFTERIFGIDGIGNWSLTALKDPVDLPVLSAAVIVSATLVVLANLAVDILYSFLDPRVSLE